MDNIDHNTGYVTPAGGMDRETTTGSKPLRAASSAAGSRTVFLAMLLIPGCASLLYVQTFASMIEVWRNSSTFVYGFLVLPVSAFLVWQRREALSYAAARPSLAGFAFLAAAVFFWLLSSEAYAQAGQHLAFIAVIVTGIWAVLGTRNARVIRFPLLFAFFSVPLGEFLIPPLMNWTAGFTVWALRATGIPVYLEGYVFALPTGTFEVAEACSGIRYLLVAVVLAVFFAHERFSSPIRRIIFVLGTAAGMLVANGVRAYLIVLIAHLSEMKSSIAQDHIFFGWVVFVVAIAAIFWFGNRFADTAGSERALHRADHDSAPGSAGGHRALFALVGAIAIMALGPLAQQVARSAHTYDATIVILPRAIEPWLGPGPTFLAYRPSFTGAFEATHAGYSSVDGTVDVHGIFFAEQSQGSELVSEGSRIYGERWRLIRRPRVDSVTVQGRTVEVKSLVVTDGRQDVLLWYWYDVGGRLTTSDVATKVYHAIQGVLGRSRGDAALILATPASKSGDGGDSARLEQFLDGHLAALSACLRSASPESANCTDQL